MNAEPAFPVNTELKVGDRLGHSTGTATYQFPGMTLRDYFAAKAMPLAMNRLRENYSRDDDDWHWDEHDWESIAEHSYSMAEAMLKVRQA